MFLDNFGFGVEQHDVISFSQLDLVRQEGVGDTSRVSQHTSVLGCLFSHSQEGNYLRYIQYTWTFKLRPSSAGMMSAIRVQLRGFLSPLC